MGHLPMLTMPTDGTAGALYKGAWLTIHYTRSLKCMPEMPRGFS